MDKIKTQITVPTYMTDKNKRLRASAFMELAQEIAVQGAKPIGLSDKDLKPINAVWVLARMQVKVERTAIEDEAMCLQTWHKGMKGAQFIRDYQLVDGEGKIAVNSTSSWLIMDIKERRMLHGAALEGIVSTEPQCEGDAIASACPRITIPSSVTMNHVSDHKILYSDIDSNNHTNNTKYVLWSMDVLPYELVSESEIDEFFINFNRESHYGETVKLFAGEDNGTWFVEGKAEDDAQIFISKYIFKNK